MNNNYIREKNYCRGKKVICLRVHELDGSLPVSMDYVCELVADLVLLKLSKENGRDSNEERCNLRTLLD